MKTFKDFLYMINEAVPEHLRKVTDSWDHHSEVSPETKGKINNALGSSGFKVFPLDAVPADIDPDVAEHLTKHNWQVTDYAKGIASKKTMTTGNVAKGILPQEKTVQEKIGSILERTSAPDHVKKAFTNDPARTSSSKSGMSVLVTTTPRGIGSCTSGTSWARESCMNMDTGGNRRFLEQDSKHASHFVYLVHDNDEGTKTGEPVNPLARTSWKPYHSKDGDTVFRPENRTYGNGGTQFENTSSNLSKKLYPAHGGITYTKNENIYDDTKNTTYRVKSKDEIEKSILTGKPIIDHPGDSLDKELIDHAINHYKSTKDALPEREKSNSLKYLPFIGNLNSQHITTIHKLAKESGNDSAINELARNHGDKFSTKLLDEYLASHDSSNLPNRLLMNNKLPQSVVDNLSTSKYSFVRRSLLKPHHYYKIINNYMNNKDNSVQELNDNKDHLSKEHIDTLSKKSGDSLDHHDIVMNHPDYSEEHHKNLLKNSSTFDKRYITRHSKFASMKDTESGDSSLDNLIENKNLIDKNGKEVKDTLMTLPTISHKELPESISKHLSSDDYKKIVKTSKNVKFESPKDSNRYLTTLLNNIKSVDKVITKHRMTEQHKNPTYKPKDDEVYNKMVDVLKGRIERFTKETNDHIDSHITHEDTDDNLVNLTDSRSNLNELKDLKNFNIDSEPNNSKIHDAFKNVKDHTIIAH